MPPPMENNP